MLKRNMNTLRPEGVNLILEHLTLKQKSRIFNTMKHHFLSKAFNKNLKHQKVFYSFKNNYLLSKSLKLQDLYLTNTKNSCQNSFKHLLLAHLHTCTLQSLIISTQQKSPKGTLLLKIEELNTKILKRSLRNILASPQPIEEDGVKTSVALTSLIPLTLRSYLHQWQLATTVDSYRNPQLRRLMKSMKQRGFTRFIVKAQLSEYTVLRITHKELSSTHKVCARALEISR